MDAMVIEGGRKLKGTVKVSGAKNAALPIMMASILNRSTSTLSNIPHLRDVFTAIRLLEHIGCKTTGLKKGNLVIDSRRARKPEAPYELVKTMRASVLLLGPLLARFHAAKVSLPGGCAIGARPINFHLEALEKMGAEIQLESGYVIASAKKLKGADIRFPDRTVTGTENIMMAATLAEGKTILRNAAQEPEIVDLAEFLCNMGARIMGAGSDTIIIHGVSKLHEASYRIMGDRIEAGTFMVAAALTQGDVAIKGISIDYLRALIDKLREAGVRIQEENGGVRVTAGHRNGKRLHSVDIDTQPYPGFPTDMQAQFMVLMALTKGKSLISENIFENRFMHVAELERMGAKIRLDGRSAMVHGVPKLTAAPLMATDLRASASLVLAGLCARGQTRISRVYHLDRGYERIEKKLRALGARIRRVKE